MAEILTWLQALLAGLLLGVVFYGGLWWTVRQGVQSPRPALWFAAGLPLRFGVVLVGFHVVGGGQWQRLAACFAGFILARRGVAWLVGPPGGEPPPRGSETPDAP